MIRSQHVIISNNIPNYITYFEPPSLITVLSNFVAFHCILTHYKFKNEILLNIN